MSTPTNLSLNKLYSGKVRDLYEVDGQRMLMVASDRLSAFDVILAEPIPDKGKILTAISNFWFDKFSTLVPNHFTGDRVEEWCLPPSCPWSKGVPSWPSASSPLRWRRSYVATSLTPAGRNTRRAARSAASPCQPV